MGENWKSHPEKWSKTHQTPTKSISMKHFNTSCVFNEQIKYDDFHYIRGTQIFEGEILTSTISFESEKERLISEPGFKLNQYDLFFSFILLFDSQRD